MEFQYLFLAVLFIGCLSSCSKEDLEVLDEQENTVTCKVYGDIPDTSITISGGGISILIVKGSWEKIIKNKDYVAQIEAICEDQNNLLTAEIYINGKLKKRGEANGYLKIATAIKGSPIFGGL